MSCHLVAHASCVAPSAEHCVVPDRSRDSVDGHNRPSAFWSSARSSKGAKLSVVSLVSRKGGRSRGHWSIEHVARGEVVRARVSEAPIINEATKADPEAQTPRAPRPCDDSLAARSSRLGVPLHLSGMGGGDDKCAKEVLLLYCDEAAELAHKVAAETKCISLSTVTWSRFADGFPDLFITDALSLRDRHVAFLASFHTPGAIFEQLAVIYAIPRLFVRSFTLVLPYFPTGTVERMEDEGDIATAVTLARMLSALPLSRGGPTPLVIFDIHALQERFYFSDNVMPCFLSAIPLLKEALEELPDANNVTIAYPDEGAWKRFHMQFQGYPEIICTKVRDGDKRIVQLKEGQPLGRHVVIVDDLVQSGGTLLQCANVLHARGAVKVSAYATHGVFPQESWKRFTQPAADTGKGFTHFWISDSCSQTVAAIRGVKPFEILSLSASIAAALQI
eukprot:jgi/Mesvir1/787/Mv17385-RA.1